MYRRQLSIVSLVVSLILVASSARAQFDGILTDVHVHLTPNYVGGWDLGVYDFDNDEVYDPNTTIIYVSPLGRTTQPGGAQWNFIGAGSGNTYWRTPQNPATNLISLSFETEATTPGTFDWYLESDPRVPAIAQPWMKMKLVDLRGPGEFALWQQSGSSLSNAWISSTSGGIDPTDFGFVTEGGHVHYYGGYTKQGYYELDFQASGHIGGSVNSSAVQTYHVVVAPPVLTASLTNSSVVGFDDPALEKVLADSGDGLFAPLAVTYDAKANVYATDVLRSRIMKYDLEGNGSVFANSADGLTTPSGLAMNSNGDLYVSNYLTNTVVRVDSAGVGTPFADGNDGLSSPFGMALDDSGNLYVADFNHSRILKFDSSGNATTFADSGDGLLAPIGVAIDALGQIYVADVLRSRVTKFTTAGIGTIFADSGDGLTTPSGLSFDLFGNLYVSNYLSNTIVKVTSAGVGSTFATAADGINSPFGVSAYNPLLASSPSALLANFAAVPEPASGLLALSAAATLAAFRWRNRQLRLTRNSSYCK
jgi:hypothetical protein